MNAGLPGTGIGGLFYIASALWMPVNRALHGRAHDGRDWRRVFAQGLIAGGILWTLAATGSWLTHIVAPAVSAVAPGAGTMVAQQAEQVIRWIAIVGTAGLLLFVLLSVELARLFVRRRPPRAPVPISTLRLHAPAELSDVA